MADSAVNDAIHKAIRALSIKSADLQGDFTWTVPHPTTYSQLPDRLAAAQDWQTFKLIMCDLRFLWRKLQVNGAASLVRTYESSSLILAAEGFQSERLDDYYNFFLKHIRLLQKSPNSIFALALSSKDGYVRNDTMELVEVYKRLVEDWHARIERENASRSGLFQNKKRKPTPFAILHFVNVKIKLASAVDFGVAACMDEQTRRKLSQVLHGLVRKILSASSTLYERGLGAFTMENRAILGLDKLETMNEIQSEHPKGFLDLVGLWDDSDREEYASLSIFIPSRVWTDEERRQELERNLCAQVAEAARAPADFVDIAQICCNEQEARTGTTGKALMKIMENVKSLQVTVLAGKGWPKTGDIVGKADRIVSLNLRVGRRSKAARGRQIPPRLAVITQKKVLSTQSRPGEMHPMNPVFNETFELPLYTVNQDLVVMCYDMDKGTRNVIGELVLHVEDVLSECHEFEDEVFERTYVLCKPGTKKPVMYRSRHSEEAVMKTASISMRFKFMTMHAPPGSTPANMAERVLLQARDPRSMLRVGSIVTGPAFHDEEGAWDTVRLYISSNYQEFHAERQMLHRFVLPALYIKCLGLRVKFEWVDLSNYGSDGLKEDMVKRLEALRGCKLRTYDQQGANCDAVFMLALLGEKRGRMLDARDIRRLGVAEQMRKGAFQWAVDAANKGVSATELEVRFGLLSRKDAAVSVLCIRNSAFTDDRRFFDMVPRDVRMEFIERDPAERQTVYEWKKAMTRTEQPIIHYSPSFRWFGPMPGMGKPPRSTHSSPSSPTNDQSGESSAEEPELNFEDVKLDGLEDFALQVYERLWTAIRQRYPVARARSAVKQHRIEHSMQLASLHAQLKPLVIVPDQTQAGVLVKLGYAADFLRISAPVTYLVGIHGSGKSALITKLIDNLGVIPEHLKAADDMADLSSDMAYTLLVRKGPSKLRTYVLGMILAKKMQKLFGGFGMRDTANEENGEGGDHEKKEATEATSVIPGSLETAIRDKEVRRVADMENKGREVNDEEQQKELTRVWECIQTLVHNGVAYTEIEFRMRDPAIVFFFKRPTHTTTDLLSYLCSSLLDHKEEAAPSWRRFESLLRQRVTYKDLKPDFVPGPVLLILDGLSQEERAEMRRVVLMFAGKVRVIMVVDTNSVLQSALSVDRSHNQQRDTQVLVVPPLALDERTQIMGRLMERLGPRNRPSNLEVLTQRESAEYPLYLVLVVGYIQACMALHIAPKPLRKLKHGAVELIRSDYLPLVHSALGEEPVRMFLAIITQEPMGLTKKEIQMIMVQCGMVLPESTHRLLSDSFRPLSDPPFTSSGGKLAMTRAFILEALVGATADARSGFGEDSAGRGVTPGLAYKLSSMMAQADAQDVRLKALAETLHERAQASNTTSASMMSDEEDEDGGPIWLLDGEEEAIGGECDGKASEGQQDLLDVDDVTVTFGEKEMTFDRDVFETFCAGQSKTYGTTGARSKSLDINEAVKLLRHYNILPQFVTRAEAARVFRAANREHDFSGSHDTNLHELDYREFLYFMRKLQNAAKARSVNIIDRTKAELAATAIQKKARALQARAQAKKLQAQKSVQELLAEKEIQLSEEDQRKLVLVQAMARRRKEKKALERRVALKRLASPPTSLPHKVLGRPAIRGRRRKGPPLEDVQRRFQQVFETAQDAFVYFDNDGNDRLTRTEFLRGMIRVGCQAVGISKLSAIVAADGVVDVVEFLRTFAWHDIRNIDHALQESKLQRSTMVSKAEQRIAEGVQSGGDRQGGMSPGLGGSFRKAKASTLFVDDEDNFTGFGDLDGEASVARRGSVDSGWSPAAPRRSSLATQRRSSLGDHARRRGSLPSIAKGRA